jgi:hypothetical protein
MSHEPLNSRVIVSQMFYEKWLAYKCCCFKNGTDRKNGALGIEN